MKIDRLLSIVIYLLNRELVSAKELAARFDVTVRTIQRDMDSLQNAGIPIFAISGPSGGYGIMETWKMDRQLVSLDDLFYILTALGGISETLPNEKLGGTLEKMKSLLPGDQEKVLREKRQKLYVDFSLLGGGRRNEDVFALIQRGIDEDRLLRFQYTNNKLETSQRTVEPMTLLFKWRSWYLYAYCRLREEYRLFRISKVREAELLPKRFERRTQSVEVFLEDLEKTGSIKKQELLLKFHPQFRSVAEDMFQEEIEETEEDGSVLVKTALPEDGWLYGFLLSFGSFLEVLEPKRLRKLLKEEGERIAQLYREG